MRETAKGNDCTNDMSWGIMVGNPNNAQHTFCHCVLSSAHILCSYNAPLSIVNASKITAVVLL